MTFLTHMQFHGLKTKIPALLEFMLGSPFLIFPCLLRVSSSMKSLNLADNNFGRKVVNDRWVPDMTGVKAIADALSVSTSLNSLK